MKAPAKRFFRADYRWQDGGAQRRGHTVVTARSQAEADAWLQRRNRHVEVINGKAD